MSTESITETIQGKETYQKVKSPFMSFVARKDSMET